MNCDEVNKKYKDYMLGKLPEEDWERITDHIVDCFDCFQMDQKENGLRLERHSGGKGHLRN